MLTFAIKTYGCQMNKRDSEAVSALLRQHGFALSREERTADLVLVNTCSVRDKAEVKAVGKLGLMVAAKRTAPARMVGAMGCMVERMGAELFARVPGLDFAVGPSRLAAIPGIVDRVRAGKGPVLDVGTDRERDTVLSGHSEADVTAFVTILLGCNRRCTYCIVPTVRGEEWSRPLESIAAEVRQLAAHGVREVTLLGQSVMAYGRENAVGSADVRSRRGYREPLPKLLERVDGIEGIERVRFTSGHPAGCTAELAQAMAGLPAVCEHMHLPVQAGSDRILKRMVRGYSVDEYRAAVARLREAVPDLAVTTDIIVGFPSETEAEFEATRSLMDEIQFDNAFIFKYSPRPGTAAARWPDDVSEDEKQRRNRILLADQDARSRAIHERWIGTKCEVLVTGTSLRNSARLAGRTRTNKIVVFERDAAVKAGALVDVRIDRAEPQTLYGKWV